MSPPKLTGVWEYRSARRAPERASGGFSLLPLWRSLTSSWSNQDVRMWELTVKEAEHWKLDAFEFWLLEETLESPLDCKEIQPVNPNGNQPWTFIERTDGEAEASIFWPPDVKSQLIGKDPDAGKDWRQEKGVMKDEMVLWHHQASSIQRTW